MSIPRSRRAAAASVSLLVHLVVIAAVIGVQRARTLPAHLVTGRAASLAGIVWLPKAGASAQDRGGGGSGNHSPMPAGKLSLRGRDAATVPAGKPDPAPVSAPSVLPGDVQPPIAQLDISAFASAADFTRHPGVTDGLPGSDSPGPGSGGRAGGGNGSGEGDGLGPGRGPGSGGNLGGGPRTPGTPGLREPRVLREVKPVYTVEAMRARLQGTAIVEAIVLADGTVGEAHVVKSVDPTLGLDQEALKAARKWLFQPGTLKGQPVAVLVWIELAFAIR